jgi:hypothetical protein
MSRLIGGRNDPSRCSATDRIANEDFFNPANLERILGSDQPAGMLIGTAAIER